MYGDDELIPLSGIQHFTYCERQWALIVLDRIWADNRHTVKGELFHARVDTPGYATARGVRAERGVRLCSYALGFFGVADIVERGEDGSVVPVEYKVGRPKTGDCDVMQLVAQAMCLEEMEDVRVSAGVLFYGKTRRRLEVQITDALRTKVMEASLRMHQLFESGECPVPVADGRCEQCSLLDECLPSLGSLRASEYWQTIEEEWSRE